MDMEIPAPMFHRFERIEIVGESERGQEFEFCPGTVVWIDSYGFMRNSAEPDQWLYLVYLPIQNFYRSFFEADLKSAGFLDPEYTYFGKRPEISFDLVLRVDNEFMEGSYRLPGEFWKVVIFRKEDVEEIQFEPTTWKRATQWESDITGLVFHFPRKAKMGPDEMLAAMSNALGTSDWTRVRGPDSMALR